MKVTNAVGLTFDFADSGAVRSIVIDPIRIGLRPGSAFSRTGANLYLRKRGRRPAYTALLGAESPSRFAAAEGGFEARGSWEGLEYACELQLAASQLAWHWRVRVENKLDHPVELDLIYVQDVGLQAHGSGLVNELYVSQYLERRVLYDPRHGAVALCRQNMKTAVGYPWLMLACAGRARAASTDGSQFYGRTFRATGEPEALRADELSGELAGEASVVALQTEPFALTPGKAHTSGFVATFMADHAQASSEADLALLPDLVHSFVAHPPLTAAGTFSALKQDRFQAAKLLAAEDLTHAELEQLFGSSWRHVERHDGMLLSFFRDTEHVVLRAKELLVERPHGHILQATRSCLPDESVVSSTAFACGVFNSHLTHGNTNFNTLLSVCTNPATPAFEGQRLLVHSAGGEFLLGVPSAFVIGLTHCTWIYKHQSTLIQVRSWTSAREPRVNLDVRVLRGGPLRMALTHQLDALNGWTIHADADHQFVAKPRAGSMLSGAFPQAKFRLVVGQSDAGYTAHHEVLDGDNLFVIDVRDTTAFFMSVVCEVTGPVHAEALHDVEKAWQSDAAAAVGAWRELNRKLTLSGAEDIAAISEILPWYGANALVHYLTPYGLEQFSGAAWGTRDVCQGPVELLLCQEKYAEAKQVLRKIFSHQNPDGGWPQWWMFDSYKAVRADEAHGDIIYWCILALCSYIKASGDFSILDEPLPYFGEQTRSKLIEHVDKIVDLVVRSFVPSTALVQFGGGDWNDSLQPVSHELAQRLISSWTVQMSYQAFTEYREICERAGHKERAERLGEYAERIYADFHKHLMKDGVVAGYGLVSNSDDHGISVLLHPSDTQTGVHYSLLPMNRGVISGMFDKDQAERHQKLIAKHLTGPDGARLMDKPLRYRGGPQSIFQRAESSTYFGREIGLMYTHEHLRFAESQARLGNADAFLHALRQAIAVDYQTAVPQGAPRQSNCYYSSSDVVFKSRYEADKLYQDVVAGKMPLQGGWRVYSSGPGIYLSLIVSHLLGLRIQLDSLILDPVLPHSLDGLQASLIFRGKPVTFHYHVKGQGFGPSALSINGKAAAYNREPNPYREGGAVVALQQFLGLLKPEGNHLLIEV